MNATARALADLERELARVSGAAAVPVGGLEPFGDGHSGFTYAVEIEEEGRRRPCVLRLSPPGARIAGPADVGRQGEIMRSLASSRVPVPAVLACSSDPVIDGRSYMLVERVVGEGFAALAGETSDELVADLAIEALKELHALSAPSGEAPRTDVEELDRWRQLAARTPAEVRGRAEELGRALEAAPPAPRPPALVHGDFHYGNLLFRDRRVVAVLDWEIASVGSPGWDLGSLIVASIRRRFTAEPNSMGSLEVEPSWLVARYGCDEAAARWYGAAACLKYAAIIGFNYELHRSGRREDPEYARLIETMRGLPEAGFSLLA
jgi:aminoglycoside phosphotransferase (APT) family kinase protein